MLLPSLPAALQARLSGRHFTVDTLGQSESDIFLFDDAVLKVAPQSREAENELQMLQWLSGKIPVPQVLFHTCESDTSFLLMSRLSGVLACDKAYMQNPEQLARLLAQGLKMLWAVDISDCPCQNTLDRKLRAAQYNIEHGSVDVDDAEPDTFGAGGFRDPEHLLSWLCDNRHEEEPVLSHGDYCLPNIFLQGGKISGFLDLGRAGTADKWQDIALCLRSLRQNFAGKFSGQPQPGFSDKLLFDALGLKPDWEKIRYYILLDELF